MPASANSHSSGEAQLARRQLLKAGAATAGAGLLAAHNGGSAADSISSSGPASPATQPFIVPLPVYRPKQPVSGLSPPLNKVRNADECGRPDHQHFSDFPVNKFYEMRVEQKEHSFHPHLPNSLIWGYDGILPGPTFVARYGEPVCVRIHNNLPSPTNHVGYGSPEITTHLHNLHTGSESDGFTGDWYSAYKFGPTMTAPGSYKDHLYSNCYAGYDKAHDTNGDPREALGTLWYHDHRMDFTGPNVYRGLTGFYLLFDHIDSGDENDPNRDHPDPKMRALCLPSGVGEYDIPLVFHDKQFDSSGYLVYDQFNNDGVLGDKLCVNGKIQPYYDVEPRKYRFRLLDGGPSRFYEFYLTHNGRDQAFTYIANDGNLLPAPLLMSKVRLGVAERADIVIDFSKYPPGSRLYLVNRLEQINGRGPTGNILRPGTPVLEFRVGSVVTRKDNSRVPATLRELPPVDLKEVVRTRTWEFDRTNGGWTVNGKLFDVRKPTAVVKRGTAEIWVLRVKGDWTHPIHIHFEEGRILSRNGAPPAPHERGRKDVYVVGNGEELRVFLRFRDYTGKYMMHCHNLIHEDHAMMIRWDIEA